MFQILSCLVAIVYVVAGSKLNCYYLSKDGRLSRGYNETIAHAIHSMTVEGLKLFNSSATIKNQIPTVAHDLTGMKTVRHFAPGDILGSDFETHTMNTIDKILSNLGQPTDGLGPNWSPIERVIHNFHMWDLWTKIQKTYSALATNLPPSNAECACLLDTDRNGITKAVQWVADHYKVGTPITLLNRPIPKLTDAKSWAVWKARLLHYYTPAALQDAAMYIYCVSRDM